MEPPKPSGVIAPRRGDWMTLRTPDGAGRGRSLALISVNGRAAASTAASTIGRVGHLIEINRRSPEPS